MKVFIVRVIARPFFLLFLSLKSSQLVDGSLPFGCRLFALLTAFINLFDRLTYLGFCSDLRFNGTFYFLVLAPSFVVLLKFDQLRGQFLHCCAQLGVFKPPVFLVRLLRRVLGLERIHLVLTSGQGLFLDLELAL